MPISTGDLLMGLGAAVGGTGPQFLQNLQQREQQKLEQKRVDYANIEKAMYQDAYQALQMKRKNDFDGIIALGKDHRDMLQKIYPEADLSGINRMIQNAILAKQGDPVAINTLGTELTYLASRGLLTGAVKVPEAQKPITVKQGEIVYDPNANEVLYTADEKPPEPITDIGKLKLALKTGEITPSEFNQKMAQLSQSPEIAQEKNAALNAVRSDVESLNKNLSEVATSYNKVMSLEPQMRKKNRGAINAGIMNVARLISPGVVTDRDAAALSGADTLPAAIFGFLNGKGIDTNQLMRIVDPANPDTFDVDGLLAVAKNVTSAGIPALQARINDSKRVATTYEASEKFMKSYFGEGDLQRQISNIMNSISNIPPISKSALDNGITEAQWMNMTPEGRASFPR